MTDDQLREAFAFAWIGKKFKQLANVSHMSPQERRDHIQHLLDKDIGEDSEDPKDANGKPIKKDKKRVEQIMERFPSDERNAILKFQRELDDAEKERQRKAKEIEKAAKAAAAAASRPTTRPGDAPKPAVKPDATAPAKTK